MRFSARDFLAAAVLIAGTAPSAAQWPEGPYRYHVPPPYVYGGGGGGRILARDVIVDRLEDQGYDDVGRPRLDGDTYVVEAVSPSGAPVRLIVDARYGDVLQRFVRRAPRFGEVGREEIDVSPRARMFPPEEMPNAPRFRPGEPEDSGSPRRQGAWPEDPETSGALGRQATRPVGPIAPIESQPLAPPLPLGRPADSRLDPQGDANRRTAPERPREAARSDPAPARAPAPSRETASAAPRPIEPAPSGVYGVNPDAGRNGANRAPTRPKPASPAASSGGSQKPAGDSQNVDSGAKPSPPAVAQNTERKPVRVIQGVTPLNGAQSGPPPQNNVGAPASPAQAPAN